MICGGGSSTANQSWIAGAVERRGRFGVGRIRLARIADRSSASLIPFVVANTEPGSRLRTDENAAYRAAPDRGYPGEPLALADTRAHKLQVDSHRLRQPEAMGSQHLPRLPR
ncbi:transposase [Sinorhizobium fredii]|uniref:transposase n=1 Tax=Rhizobium fredii TaxID=380 RepID=UPI00139D648B|nr:hypothetical protein [Sinorhizobium fredii]